jgi:hypothetical protein
VMLIGHEKGNDTQAASATTSAWASPKAIARRCA